MQAIGQPFRISHEARGARVLADTDENALARRPGSRDRAGLHLGEQLLIHPIGGAAQRKLAKGRQVGRREKVLQCPLGLLRDVNLSVFETLDQIVGSEINQFHGVGTIEHGVWHGLAHANVRDLRDHVIEAFDVLDVDGRVDVDAAAQELFNVEIALWVTAAGRIGVGEFIDKHDLRTAGDDAVKVHLFKPLAFVFDTPARDDFEAFQKGFRFLAAMGLYNADDDVIAVLFSGAGLLQHFVGLADARRRPHEDSELADAPLFPPGRFKQGLWRGSGFRVAPLVCHQPSLYQAVRRSFRATAPSSDPTPY